MKKRDTKLDCHVVREKIQNKSVASKYINSK